MKSHIKVYRLIIIYRFYPIFSIPLSNSLFQIQQERDDIIGIYKAKSSIRTLPINKILLEGLKMPKNENSKIHEFNDNYFITVDAFPISSNALADRKNKNCELAGAPK